MIDVSIATDKDHEDWNDYLLRRAINHHSYAWGWRQIIRRVFSHQPHYLIARETSGGNPKSEAVVGICPIFFVRSVLFGKTLISLPYLNAGGVIADSESAFTALISKAEAIANELQVDYLELRHRAPLSWKQETLTERSHKIAMQLELNQDPEKLFSSFPPKLRSQIRRPSKSGIYAEVSDPAKATDAAVDAFYSVFAENMRDLGTPVYPKRLFHEAVATFGRSARVIVIWSERKPVAAGITLGQGDTLEIPWASSLRKYNKLSPNMLLYWEAIRTGCLDGYRYFDFGRSSLESGTFKFKEQWGAKPKPLYWYYLVLSGKIPDVSPKNPKFTALVSCWKKLPLTVANNVGPWLTKSLP